MFFLSKLSTDVILYYVVLMSARRAYFAIIVINKDLVVIVADYQERYSIVWGQVWMHGGLEHL